MRLDGFAFTNTAKAVIIQLGVTFLIKQTRACYAIADSIGAEDTLCHGNDATRSRLSDTLSVEIHI